MTSTQTRHRSFSTRKAAGAAPVTFDLNDEATFTCRAQVPGTVLLEHVERLSDGKTAAGELLRIWRDVFDDTRETRPVLDDDGAEVLDDDGEVIVEEVEGTSEHDRFRAYVDDPNHEVDVQDLGEVLTYVLGELSGRPTNAPSPSARGRSTTGSTSPSGSNASGKKGKGKDSTS